MEIGAARMNDLDILRRHVTDRDPSAFGELVTRHLDWVYSAALRQVRDPHMADDITQAVFLALSQQARKLAAGVVLEAWLFQVTRRASAMAMRAAGRRRTHERRAAIMNSEERAADMNPQDWETLAPVLDEVVEKLADADRQSILLRYYQRKSFAEIGQALAIGEPAARKRISRAIEKMRAMLSGRGMAFAAGTLAAGMLSYTSQAAPASTAASVAAVTATPGLASPTVLSLSRGALKMMPWTNAKIAACAGLLVLAAIGLSIAVAQVAAPGKGNAPAAPPDAKPTAAKPNTAAAPAPATKPAPAQPLTPKGVVVAAYKAGLAGDEDGMLKCFTGLTPQQEVTLKQAVHVLSAVDELQKAITAEFGEKTGKQFAGMGLGVDPGDVLNAPERITGDTAIVDLGRSGPGELPLLQVGDAWKISADSLRTLNTQSLAQWERKAPVLRKLAADITAGKYATLNDLQQAMVALMR